MSVEELIDARRKELIAKGYPRGIVNTAMDYARASARGNAEHYGPAAGKDPEDLIEIFLPRHLQDAESYIKSFGHNPR